jgi:diacylglycerol kinase family enzyme
LDLGVARGPWGERYFIEGLGAGLFANLLARPKKKNAKGGSPEDIVVRALQRLQDMAVHCESVEVAAALDGKDISGRYLLLEAINLRYVGPNMFLAPNGKPGDGNLDVVLVTEDERARLMEYLNKWQDNRERLAMLPTQRGERLQIEWTGYELHIDDKLYPREDDDPEEMAGVVEAWIEPAAVELLVPEAKK